MSLLGNIFKSRKQVILEDITDSFIKLSTADKRAGLSRDDLIDIVAKSKTIENTLNVSGSAKAQTLADSIVKMTGSKVSPWVVKTLGFLAYRYAKVSGVIP